MKKTLIAVLAMASLVSCNESREEAVNKNIKEYISKNAKDPASYEPMETVFKERIPVSFFAKQIVDEANGYIESSQDKIDTQNSRIKEFNANNMQSLIPSSEAIIKTCNEIITLSKADLKKYEPLAKDTTTAYIFYNHKCRLKNGFGALDIANYLVYTDKQNSIVAINEDFAESLKSLEKDFKSKH